MANPEHLRILEQGVNAWNAWRREKSNVKPDFRKADLYVGYLNNLSRWILSRPAVHFDSDQDNVDVSEAEDQADREAQEAAEKLLSPDEFGWPRKGADLGGVDFSGADLMESDLTRANLSGANLTKTALSHAVLTQAILSGAHLTGASLYKADLNGADLSGADLSEADLSGADLSNAGLYSADLSYANLSNANLVRANLTRAALIETDLTDADLTGCRIYGISAWGPKLSGGTRQKDLVVTPDLQPNVTVDDIEVAQFLYLLLHNEKLQRVIDTITTRVVLILGRFSIPERKGVLDALRDELRKPGRSYVPVVFDFEKPRSQTTINTVMLLARIARFVIADISDAKSVLQELQAIVPSSPKLPVQPIIITTQEEPGMFDSFEAYPWFLKVYRYDALAQLRANLDERVIDPAEAKVAWLRA